MITLKKTVYLIIKYLTSWLRKLPKIFQVKDKKTAYVKAQFKYLCVALYKGRIENVFHVEGFAADVP